MEFYLSGLGNMYGNLDHIKEAVVEADRLGFDGALMPDHYMWGAMGGHAIQDGYSTLETWVTLTYLAAKTENISLGTLVTPIPFRSPGMLAKMISTLDVLSNGRVVLGVGAGWSQVEFEGYSEWDKPGVRVNKTKEGLDLMIKLWTEDEVTFKGKYYEAKGAVLKPKPVQKPYPRLLFGGTGDRMLGLAGKYGDICYIPMWMTGGNIEEARAKVMNAAKRANREDKVAFMAGVMGARGPVDLGECSKMVEAAQESGAKYYMVAFPRGEGCLDSMKSFAREVMSSYR
jgi:alkanesulfonate monooxygenase SsuD/methylene tetrahydromethanopterin reductase-like flavin-dependent oxidoreductase (luciferase family)